MSATSTPSDFELAKPDGGFGGAPESISADLKRFHRWLIAALLFHAALLTGLISTGPRQLGDASGVDDAISVSLVTEAELRGNATVEDRAAGEPTPPPQLRQATPEPEQSTPPEQKADEQRADEQRADAQQQQPDTQTAAVPQPQADPPPEPEAAPTKPEPEAIPELRESLGTEPSPQETKSPKPAEKADPAELPARDKTVTDPQHKSKPKPQDAKPAPAKPKKTRTAKLDLRVPQANAAPPGSRGAGFERPPGITRSGENDDFARGVIRALQATMPQLSNTFGRVRVRITLNSNGNLVSTEVLNPSNVPGLDQSVVFATKQTSFPLPPYKANSADLVFVVTYIYH